MLKKVKPQSETVLRGRPDLDYHPCPFLSTISDPPVDPFAWTSHKLFPCWNIKSFCFFFQYKCLKNYVIAHNISNHISLNSILIIHRKYNYIDRSMEQGIPTIMTKQLTVTVEIYSVKVLESANGLWVRSWENKIQFSMLYDEPTSTYI